MTHQLKTTAALSVLLLALHGCSSGSDGDSDTSTNTGDTVENTDNNTGDTNDTGDSSSSDNTTDTNDTTDTSNEMSATFFNDDSGFSFANTLGGSLGQITSTIIGAFGDDNNLGGPITAQTPRMAEVSTCAGGGSQSVSIVVDDVTDNTSFILDAENCVEDGLITSGSMNATILATEDDSESAVDVSFNNFTSASADTTSSITGSVSMSVIENEITSESTVTLSGDSFVMLIDNETISYTNYSVFAMTNDLTGAASFSGRATITVPEGTVTFDIDPAFSIPGGNTENPVSGRLSMTASDGSSLVIDADTGDTDTFSYSVTDGLQTTTGIERWDETDIDSPL